MKRVTWGFGSRRLNVADPAGLVKDVMDRSFNFDEDVLITGGAGGTDTLMERRVKDVIGMPAAADRIVSVKPNWSFPGAANARNVEMAKTCDEAIGIWNPGSITGIELIEIRDPGLQARFRIGRSGTLHSIIETIRKRKRLHLHVVVHGRMFSFTLKNDEIPDDCEFAIKKSRDVTGP